MMRVAFGVARHPGLWTTALRQWRLLTPSGWWRHRPWLPVPSVEYWRFRMLTQYGDTRANPSAGDVVNYLAWCRDEHRSAR